LGGVSWGFENDFENEKWLLECVVGGLVVGCGCLVVFGATVLVQWWLHDLVFCVLVCSVVFACYFNCFVGWGIVQFMLLRVLGVWGWLCLGLYVVGVCLVLLFVCFALGCVVFCLFLYLCGLLRFGVLVESLVFCWRCGWWVGLCL